MSLQEICAGEKESSLEFARATRVPPDYPARAARLGIGGWVVVEGTIGRNGEVLDARVLRSHPPEMFDQAALTAFRQWRYCPSSDPSEPRVVQTRLKFEP